MGDDGQDFDIHRYKPACLDLDALAPAGNGSCSSSRCSSARLLDRLAREIEADPGFVEAGLAGRVVVDLEDDIDWRGIWMPIPSGKRWARCPQSRSSIPGRRILARQERVSWTRRAPDRAGAPGRSDRCKRSGGGRPRVPRRRSPRLPGTRRVPGWWAKQSSDKCRGPRQGSGSPRPARESDQAGPASSPRRTGLVAAGPSDHPAGARVGPGGEDGDLGRVSD